MSYHNEILFADTAAQLDCTVLSEFTLRCTSVFVMVLQVNHVWFLNSGLNKSDVFHRDVFIVFIIFIFSTLKMTNISHKQLKTL